MAAIINNYAKFDLIYELTFSSTLIGRSVNVNPLQKLSWRRATVRFLCNDILLPCVGWNRTGGKLLVPTPECDLDTATKQQKPINNITILKNAYIVIIILLLY